MAQQPNIPRRPKKAPEPANGHAPATGELQSAQAAVEPTLGKRRRADDDDETPSKKAKKGPRADDEVLVIDDDGAIMIADD